MSIWKTALLAVGLCVAAAEDGFADDAAWTGFRGNGDSHAAGSELPLVWDDEKNVAWSLELSGYGQSSPVVRNGRVFVTSIQGKDKETLVVAGVDMNSGKFAWQKEFPSSQPLALTDYVSRAAPTPVVDGDCVVAFFESGDVIALSHSGETMWTRSLTKEYGPIQGNHGLGGSPAQTAEAVIILAEHAGPSYITALDKKSGKTLWKRDRPPRVSWSSPLVCDGPQGTEILISSNGVVQSLKAADGDLLWEVTGLKGNTTNSPSATPEAVLIGSSQVGDNLLIRRGGTGDITATHVAWRAAGVSSSFGSPLIHEGRGYFVSKANIGYAVDLATGTTLWTQRLPDSTWASPIAFRDRVYFFCKNGVTVVARGGDAFEKLAENTLTLEDRLYGVAVASGSLLIRSGNRLTCVRSVGGD